MNRDRSLDEYLAIMGVKLRPYQKELLEAIIEHKEPYIFYPPNINRTYTKALAYSMCEMLKGEKEN